MATQRRLQCRHWLGPLVGTALTAVALLSAATEQQTAVVPPGQLPDRARELALKITAPFTLASVGDIIEMRPVSQLADPALQSAIKIVRDADVAVANMESAIGDITKYEGARWGTIGTKEVAADVKAMGFDLVNRANNWLSIEAMGHTSAALDAVGIVHAGSGSNLEEARAARFIDTPKGRIGMVGMVSVGTNPATGSNSASYRVGNSGGSPGANPINLTRYYVVSQAQLDALRKVRDSIYENRKNVSSPAELPPDEPRDRLQLFGVWYKVGAVPGSLSYTMNPTDLRDTLRSIRNGKFYADFMVATIHTHDGHSAVQSKTGYYVGTQWRGFEDYPSEYPPDFLVDLAHQCIDNGADAFVGHGIHVLRGIEIYKGKPIYYGLSDFIFQVNLMMGPDTGAYRPADPSGPDLTAAEVAYLRWDPVLQPRNLEGVLATAHYDGARLLEVRLYPVDLKYADPISRRGNPHLATGDVARQILGRLQERSKPFGTQIAIEGDIGVIRVGQTLSSAAPAR